MKSLCHAILTGALAVAALQSGAAQGSGVPSSVGFFSARDGNNEIYVMDWDGKRPIRLTYDAASDVDPDISTNGRTIVFTSARTGNNDIHVIDTRGGVADNLTNNPANDGWARWSPNGRYIAFHSNRDGNFEIYVMNADGTGQLRLTNYPGIDQYPDWSPDGKQLAFRRDLDIHVLDLTDGQIRRLTDAPPLNQMPAWSPNGKHLVFMSSRAGYISVFRMNADGTDQRNLTPKTPGDLDADWISRAPSWSPNGQQIYFMSSRPSTGLDTEIFIMNADGSGATRLTHTLGTDGSPRAR